MFGVCFDIDTIQPKALGLIADQLDRGTVTSWFGCWRSWCRWRWSRARSWTSSRLLSSCKSLWKQTETAIASADINHSDVVPNLPCKICISCTVTHRGSWYSNTRFGWSTVEKSIPGTTVKYVPVRKQVLPSRPSAIVPISMKWSTYSKVGRLWSGHFDMTTVICRWRWNYSCCNHTTLSSKRFLLFKFGKVQVMENIKVKKLVISISW